MSEENIYSAGLYLRLSKDDGDKQESKPAGMQETIFDRKDVIVWQLQTAVSIWHRWVT